MNPETDVRVVGFFFFFFTEYRFKISPTEHVLEFRYFSRALRFNIANRFLTTASFFSEVL